MSDPRARFEKAVEEYATAVADAAVTAVSRYAKPADRDFAFSQRNVARHALLDLYEEMGRDTERLDWLEGELEREQVRGIRPLSLFRRNVPITRDAIDAAMAFRAPEEAQSDGE